MPFGEALFWIGVTVAGTGAWILWERHVKSTVWSLIFTALGVFAVAYSLYLPSHPNAPNPPVWVLLLVLTWGMFGYLIYDRRKRVATLTAQVEELQAHTTAEIDKIPQRVIDEESGAWEWAGSIKQLSVDAVLLKERLDRLEYEWSRSGERLDLPLADSSIPSPDAPLSWNQRELLGYRFVYREHLERVHLLAPSFTSVVMDAGFPSSMDTYRVKQMLQFHATDLGSYIVAKLKSA